MPSEASERYELPEGWSTPDPDEARRLHEELQRELPPGHLLHGLPVSTFAASDGIDDVLFRHRSEPDRFTVIHLSWLGRTEINAQHPTVEFDGTFEEFRSEQARITSWLIDQAKKRDA